MLSIKILGPGCSNCKRLEEVARQAVASLNVACEMVKVTDLKEVLAYDVLQTPSLVIEGKVVCQGRIPTVGKIVEWIQAARPGAP